MAESSKTLFFNFFRKKLTNRIFEVILCKMVKGKEARHFFSRLVPMPKLYPSPSWRTVIRHGLKLELDISDFVDWYVYFGFYDRGYEFLFSKLEKGDCVIDVGANIGYVSLRFAQHVSDGSVVAFEPSTHNFLKCEKNISLNNFPNLSVYKCGIGSRNEELLLSIQSPNNHGMNKIKVGGGKVGTDEEEVKIITIDSWISEMDIRKVDVIKIDVEGYEMEILKGAVNTISRFWPRFFIEINQTYLAGYGSSAFEIFEWLSTRDYTIYDVKGQLVNNSELLTKGQMDIYAIRRCLNQN